MRLYTLCCPTFGCGWRPRYALSARNYRYPSFPRLIGFAKNTTRPGVFAGLCFRYRHDANDSGFWRHRLFFSFIFLLNHLIASSAVRQKLGDDVMTFVRILVSPFFYLPNVGAFIDNLRALNTEANQHLISGILDDFGTQFEMKRDGFLVTTC